MSRHASRFIWQSAPTVSFSGTLELGQWISSRSTCEA